MSGTWRSWWLTGAVTTCSLAGCVTDSLDESASVGLFIAFARDFVGFEQWPSKTLPASAAEDPDGHTTGAERTVWWSQPRDAAGRFPIGTIVMKTDGETGLLAMVKRGGSYNSAGAVNWEWFRLERGAAGPQIRWRGLGPPVGGDGDGDAYSHLDSCNGCHKAASASDYVFPGVAD